MEPTKEQMHQWYVVEQLSYRQIMNLINTKNNRKIPKLLNQYGIEIRRGSEAIKAQWVNNDSRKKTQGDRISSVMQGKPSPRRIELNEVEERYREKGLEVVKIEYKGEKSHSWLTLKCLTCGKQSEKSMANSSKDCVHCQAEKGIARVKKSYAEVERAFLEKGLTLLDTEYVNSKTEMACVCNKHVSEGTIFITYEKVKEHKGCKICSSENNSERQKTPFEVVEQAFNDKDMVLMDTEYIDVDTPMAFICTNHVTEGIQYKSLYSVRKHGKCKLCNMEKRHSERPLNDRQLYDFHLKRWRLAVFKRDGFTCQCCGDDEGGNLNAHHIKNFSNNVEGRLDIENGITLCENCHNPTIKGSFHHTYGTRNNTREQLEEYVKEKQLSVL